MEESNWGVVTTWAAAAQHLNRGNKAQRAEVE